LNLVSQPSDYLSQVPKDGSDALQWQSFHDDSSGNANPWDQCADSNFTWYCNWSTSGSTVYKAWRFISEYAAQLGIYQPKVAVIDEGFWLDANGDSIPDNYGGNPLPLHPIQYNFANNTGNASGTNVDSCTNNVPCPYHGTGTSNTVAASVTYPHDGAGTGGQVVIPFLFYAQQTSDQFALAVETARLWGADIISISSGFGCDGATFWCRNFVYGGYASALDDALADGVLVVAAAGNDGVDATDTFPCYYGSVLCIGALQDGQNRPALWSNFGNVVRLWALTNITEIYPNNDGSFAVRPFGGTSASAPFVAGIAAMLKAVNPALKGDDLQNILINTAKGQAGPGFGSLVLDNRSDADGNTGRIIRSVDADAAVLNAAGGYHLKPEITITLPQNGATVVLNPANGSNCIQFAVTAYDAEDGQYGISSITWTSDVDGQLYVASNGCGGFSWNAPEGLRHITATVTNSVGISNSATIALTIKFPHITPSPVITWPPPNTSVSPGTYIVTGYANSTDPGTLGNFDCSRLQWNGSVAAIPVPNSNGLCEGQLSFASGVQQITLSATNKFGDTGQVTVALNVVPQSGLSVQILNPLNGSSVPVQNNPPTSLGLAGNATPLLNNSHVGYEWFWYYTANGPASRQLIAQGSNPNATWTPASNGLCQTLNTPQDVTIELDVFDSTIGVIVKPGSHSPTPPSGSPQTVSGSATITIKLTCTQLF
jgi:hypothetical protein